MQISSTYAHRNDLSRFSKWRLSLEERIERNHRVRALYRGYLLLKPWQKDALNGLWALQSIPPLMLMWACGSAVERVCGETDTDVSDVLGLALYVLLMCIATSVHVLGALLFVMTALFLGVLWFANLMQDYDKQF